MALNTIIQKAFGSLQIQTASEQLLLHSIGFSSLTFPVFLSLCLAHNVVYSFGMVGFSTKLSVKKREPYLIQKSFGFFLRQQAQAGSGFQNHRCLYPLLFGNRLLCDLQQLLNGFSTLENNKKCTYYYKYSTIPQSELKKPF